MKRNKVNLLGIEDVAEMLGVAPITIKRWVRRGCFPEPIRLGPKLLRWHAGDIEEYLKEQRRSKTHDSKKDQ